MEVIHLSCAGGPLGPTVVSTALVLFSHGRLHIVHTRIWRRESPGPTLHGEPLPWILHESPSRLTVYFTLLDDSVHLLVQRRPIRVRSSLGFLDQSFYGSAGLCACIDRGVPLYGSGEQCE